MIAKLPIARAAWVAYAAALSRIAVAIVIGGVVASNEWVVEGQRLNARLTAADAAEWNVFRDPRLGIEFSYPNSRRVATRCHSSNKCVALIDNSAPNGNYLAAFEVFDGPLDIVAVEQAVFQKEGDNWSANGRSAKHPVEALTGPGWRGLKSVVDCGVSDGEGFHAGAGECLWVVISNGKRSVVVDTEGIGGLDPDTMRSIRSVRFRVR
jgi:hypothetical protein